MSPHCQNCGSHVSADYQRVRGIDGEVVCCPWCDDKVQYGADVRDARAVRRVDVQAMDSVKEVRTHE